LYDKLPVIVEEEEDAMRTRRLFLRTSILPLLIIQVVATPIPVSAQPANPPNAFQAPLAAPVNGQQNAALFPGNNVTTGSNAGAQQGGAANADFDSLIDLIVSTVSTDTWAENGGGEAEIRPFPGGVLVDAAGTLQIKTRSSDRGKDLSRLRGTAPSARAPELANARRASRLRYVSLPRLEREIARRQAARKPLDATMLTLAGLQRVHYVFVYPDSGDLVLAGPAGDWYIDADCRILSSDTGQAVVRLDDLLVLWRRGRDAADSYFGCSINPRQESLAKTQAFLASTSQRPLQPGQRKRWLGTLRATVGLQDIEVFGVDPASRVASVLVEADYHMKLIGMGLVDGVDGVESYLASIRLAPGELPPSMSVLRWWFTLNYDAIHSSPADDAFELSGQGVRVLSENEMLAEQGQRVHTGQSEPLNRQFAEQFTENFRFLAAKYPVYSELRNIFDLAMVVALVQSNGLLEKAGWEPGLLSSAEQLRLPQSPVPRQVETVINHRVINRRHIVAGVSGGVMVAPGDLLKGERITTVGKQLANSKREAPVDEAEGAWWWDAPE
jgi:hypothetical protein